MHIETFKSLLATGLFNACERYGASLDAVQRKELLRDCMQAGAALYEKTGGDPQTALAILVDVLLPFLQAYPREEHASPVITRAPLYQAQNSARTVNAMFKELWNEKFTGHPLMEHLRTVSRAGALKVGDGKEVWYTQYEGTDAHYHYLPHELTKLFWTNVFCITSRGRCSHHWVLGRTGTGKTTYLKWWLLNDLKMASEGRCSVIVIDGKSLVKTLRDYRVFAPGQPLAGKLSIVDANYPIALNPFHLKRGAIETVAYMLGGLTDATEMQYDVFYWLARAASRTPDANIDTISRYLESKQPPNELSRFDKETQRWFTSVFPDLPHMTKTGVKSRLARIFQHPALVSMVNAPGNDFDLRDATAPGRVLLIDTDRATLGADGSRTLGRLFIGLIEQLSNERMAVANKESLTPIWVYIDEAHDYIADDERFIEILDKAREQKIGLTVAHQRAEQVSKGVRDALQDAHLKTRCLEMEEGKPGVFELELGTRKPITLNSNIVEVNNMFTQMPQQDYHQMRLAMLPARKPAKPAKKDDRTVV